MFLWFIISGVQKIKSIRAEQESTAELRNEKAQEDEEAAEETPQENTESNS